MLEPVSSGARTSRYARRRAETLLRERAGEIVAAVVRRAEAGDRAAMRLARQYGLPVEPPPDVLAARLAESIKRTRATVATLLAEGGIADAQVVASSGVKTRDRAKRDGLYFPVNSRNEATTSTAEGLAADGARERGALYFPVNSEIETSARQRAGACISSQIPQPAL